MAIRQILQLGDPILWQPCEPVLEEALAEVKDVIADLHDTLFEFRKVHGFGRAIAAPQIGVSKRIVYMFIDEPVAFVNPVLDELSEEMLELWDDCMSFPDLLVRLRRHRSCRITYRDAEWTHREQVLEGDLSELLQHECDHLDGVLAVSRAIDETSFSLRGPYGTFHRDAMDQ